MSRSRTNKRSRSWKGSERISRRNRVKVAEEIKGTEEPVEAK